MHISMFKRAFTYGIKGIIKKDFIGSLSPNPTITSVAHEENLFTFLAWY